MFSTRFWIQIKKKKHTANDKINALTLSPLSGLVSWLNCTKAPRNFFTLVNALFESCTIDGFADCCVDATDVGGGVVEPIVWFSIEKKLK